MFSPCSSRVKRQSWNVNLTIVNLVQGPFSTSEIPVRGDQRVTRLPSGTCYCLCVWRTCEIHEKNVVLKPEQILLSAFLHKLQREKRIAAPRHVLVHLGSVAIFFYRFWTRYFPTSSQLLVFFIDCEREFFLTWISALLSLSLANLFLPMLLIFTCSTHFSRKALRDST